MLYSKDPTPENDAIAKKLKAIRDMGLAAVEAKIIKEQDFKRMLLRFPTMKPAKMEEIYQWYKSKGLNHGT